MSKDVSPGYKEIRMNFKIDSDASPDQLKELIEYAPSLSPVFSTITRAVPVSVKLAD